MKKLPLDSNRFVSIDGAQMDAFHDHKEYFSIKIERIVRETDKAYLIAYEGIRQWVPKSCCIIYKNVARIEKWLEKRLRDQGAVFDDEGTRRYVLWRTWDDTKKVALCIGLNPSTANADQNDQIITRLTGALIELGYGGFRMVNLFTHISSEPKDLKGREGDEQLDWSIIVANALLCQKIIYAWGNFPIATKRAERVMNFFEDPKCFGVNANGTPWHPMAMMYAGLKAESVKLFNFGEHTHEKNVYGNKSRLKRWQKRNMPISDDQMKLL